MWLAGPARQRPLAASPAALRPGFSLAPGMRVGLYGGSFNPAHEGHAHVAETAMARLALDRVIWLVSPQNPLKPNQPPDLAERMAGARAWAKSPSMIISDLEGRLGTTYTIDVIRALKARFPGVRFVWLMGADNLASFHRWRGWAQIMRHVPVAVVARPGFAWGGGFAVAARRFARFRLPDRAARALPQARPPAWAYLSAPLRHISSTELRNKRAG